MPTQDKPWHRLKPAGIKALRGPPKAENPSLISQQNKQTKPITLATVWGKQRNYT
jgi:hypothetical protein